MRLLLLVALFAVIAGCGGGETKVTAPETYAPIAQPVSVGGTGGGEAATMQD